MVKLISMDDLKKKIDAGSITVVDVLGPESYERTHLPGAINIPVTEVDEKAASMLPDKSAEIAVYCMSPTWHAGEKAARALAALGYTNVSEFKEGKVGWQGAGNPIEGTDSGQALPPGQAQPTPSY